MRALLVIADIGGYTRFMTLHRLSIAHAQANTDRLLRAVIDAAPRLRLVALEGDAAFFWVPEPADEEVASTIAGLAATMHRAFHEQQQRMDATTVCPCGACEQIGLLRVKFVAHIGEVVRQTARRATKVAGVDVIVVHRMLKNSVPIPEYLLMTEPVLERCNQEIREQTSPIAEELEGIGTQTLHYLDLEQTALELAPPPPPTPGQKVRYNATMIARAVPSLLGLRR
jgi:hypothetical protein